MPNIKNDIKKKNYNLFDKYLNKISAKTVNRFGGFENIELFLRYVCDYGNVPCAIKQVGSISPMQIPVIIKQDKYLAKCVSLSLSYAAEVAEGVLYDRAINGYEELSYNKVGECIARKKKYCSKSLLEYLKANSVKYQSRTVKENNKIKNNEVSRDINLSAISNYEIEDYGAKA